MKDLRKDDQLNIRIAGTLKRRIERAALKESRRRVRAGGATIEAGPLLLECGWPGIEKILRGGTDRRVAPRRAQDGAPPIAQSA